MFPCSREHQGSEPGIVLRLLKDFGETFIHTKGESIARFGTIEGDAAYAVFDLVEKLLAHSVVPF